MIFKIQKPVATNVDPPEVLVYNQDRSITQSIPMPKEDIDAIFGDDLKQYWEAEIIEANDTKNLMLRQKVGDQDW
jgi:hypothetical protein